LRAFALVLTTAVSLWAAPAAFAQVASTPTSSTPSTTVAPTTAVPPTPNGGAAYGEPSPATTQLTPDQAAVILPDGLAAAPVNAPQEVKDAIAAANEIVGKPYVYGGGHNRSFKSAGYDCSGTVSFALKGAGLLKAPLASGPFMSWGKAKKGKWITVYANSGHAYAVIAGLRLDTSAAGERVSSGKGPRWRSNARKQSGFVARHPKSF
jgi:cell wall-associated NlpC family hydrolase